MWRVHQNEEVDRITTDDGRTILLRSRTWVAAIRLGSTGWAVSYRRPSRIEVAGTTGSTAVRIVDPVMLVRVTSVLMFLSIRRMLPWMISRRT